MRILRWIVGLVLGLVLGLILLATIASAVYDAVTSDANVPVQRLWHGRFVEADGVLTAYRSWGDHGSPVILVGGFLEPSFVWDRVGPQLAAAGHRVYALDLTGFGYSQRRGPYTLAHWADQVQAFAHALSLHDPTVVGHSLGAAVAVELARRRVASRAVLVDGDALREGGPPKLVRKALAHSPFFTAAFRLLPKSKRLVRAIVHSAYGPEHPPLNAAELDRWTRPFRAQGARSALQGELEEGIAGFTASQLRALHIQAEVIWGSRDSVDSVSAGRATARDLHAQFVELTGAGHLTPLEQPRQLAAAIAP